MLGANLGLLLYRDTHTRVHTYIQNQVGCSDCGLFAIAFAVSICLGMNPSKFIYDQENMRRHLIECIENQKFSNFLFSVNTNWKKKKVTKNESEYILHLSRSL